MGLACSVLMQHAYSDSYGYLVNVFNKSPYRVTIRTSDRAGNVIKTDGSQPNIQNMTFNLADISSFSFVIPWGSWDAPAAISIDLHDNTPFNPQNPLASIGHYELKERNYQVQLWKGNTEIDSRYRTTETHYSLLVDEAGNVSFAPPFITFSFTPYHQQIQVGSPDCSTENDISKQFKTFAKNKPDNIKILMRNTCKIVVNLLDDQGNPTDESATACFGFAHQGRNGKFIPYQQDPKRITLNYTNYHEIGCNDPACAPDPDTGISPCDKLGLSWVEGVSPRNKSHITEEDSEHYTVYYGIVDVKQ